MYYLKRNDNGIMMKDETKEHLINVGIKSYVNSLCIKNLSTYDGRKKALSSYLNQKDNIPIYIDDNTFLYPTKSLRQYDTLFINYYKVLSYKRINSSNTLLIFNNLDQITVNVSVNKIIKQHKRIETIILNFKNIT